MPRMTINGETYEIPQTDVGRAQAEYGAVPADSAATGATALNPMGAVAGGASSVVNAVSRIPGLGYAVGAGALYGGKKLIDNYRGGRSKSAPKQQNPAEARISEARAAKMEADARAATARADLAERKLAPAEAASKPVNMSRTQPASSPAAAPPKRTTKPKAAKPKRTTKPPDPIPIRTAGADKSETVPIKVEGKPKAVRGTKQRGVSKREIASRQAGMAARSPAPLSETDDIMEQLARSLHVEQGMTARGVPRTGGLRGAVRSGLRGATHPAVSLLMMLMDAGAIPEQMDEADQFGQEQYLPPELLEQMRRQPRPGRL